VRLLSVLSAVATVPVFYRLVAPLYDDRRATIACALLVLNPMYVEYAQEARAYSLSMLFATVMSYLFVRAVQTPSRAVWAAYALTAGLSAYVHFVLGLVVLAHAVSLVVRRGRRRLGLKTVVPPFAASLVLALPALYLAHRQSPTHQSILAKPSPVDLFSVFTLATGPAPSGAAVILFLLACLAATLFLVHTWRGRRALGAWQDAFVLSWFVVPIAITFAVSFSRPSFAPKYLIVSMPALLVMGAVAALLSRLNGPLIVLVLILSLAVDWAYYHDPSSKEDWRGLTAYLVQDSRPGDGLIVYAPYTRTPLDYYIERRSGAISLTPIYPTFPFSATSLASAYTSSAFSSSAARALTRSARRHRRIWIILSHTKGMPDGVRAVLRSVKGRPRLAERDFVRISLLLYGPRRAPG